MKIVPCPSCSNPVSSQAVSCPHCGHPLVQQTQPSLPPESGKGGGLIKTMALFFGGLVLVFFVWGAMQSGPEADAKSRERAAIEMCWQEQGKKSHAPAESRFIAGACERMQEEFRAKHNVAP